MDVVRPSNVVNLDQWAEPSREFTALCDEAAVVLSSPGGRDDERLVGIALELTAALKRLDDLPRLLGQAGRAVDVLNNIADHSTADILDALARIKRIGGLHRNTAGTAAPTATTTKPAISLGVDPSVRDPKRRTNPSRPRSADQQSLWSDTSNPSNHDDPDSPLTPPQRKPLP